MIEIETLDNSIDYWSKSCPNKKAIISVRSGEDISYGELNNLVNFFSKKFEININSDAICALYLDDTIVCNAIIHAIFRIGAILLPIDSELGETTQQNILSHSKADFIIIGEKNRNAKTLSKLPDVPIIKFKEKLSNYDEDIKYTCFFSSKANVDSIAMIAYTSGTTTNPKGVVLKHRNLVSAYASAIQHMYEPKIIGCIFRIATLGTLGIHFFYAQLSGATTVLLPRSSILNAKNFLEDINKYGIDFLYLVPSLVKLLNHLSKPKTLNHSCLFVSAGSPLSVSEQDFFQTKFNVVLRNIYGLTESSFAVFYGREADNIGTNDIGFPLSINAKVVDENGIELGKNQIGELWYKGDMVAESYYNNEYDSQQTFKNKWLLTGDLVKQNEEGYFTIVGRKKDLVIRGGFNIYPLEVEEFILAKKGVLNTCVFGNSNDIMGEELLAYIQIIEDIDFDSNQLIEDVNIGLGKFRSPDRYIFTIESIPLNSAGKIDKKKLQSFFQGTTNTIN